MKETGYNEKCDIWSCGVILYMMIAGCPPFFAQTTEETIALIKKGVVNFSCIFFLFYLFVAPIWNSVSKHCKALIKDMLTYEPDKRISATHALKSMFFKKSSEDASSSNADLRVSILNLRNFHTQTKFQKAVLTYCASQQLTQKAEAKIRKLFDILDKNKDGKLTAGELLEGYTKIFGDAKKAKKEVDFVMKNINFNHNGIIEYNGK